MAEETSEYAFPVWGTQGGGLVRQAGKSYVFVKAPDSCMNLEVGDKMPEEWDLIPANELARREVPVPGMDWRDLEKDLANPNHGRRPF